jgi:hypothetical protein
VMSEKRGSLDGVLEPRIAMGDQHREAARKRWANPDAHARQSAMMKAVWAENEDLRAAFDGAKVRARWSDPIYRESILAKIREAQAAPEAREKMTSAANARWADPTMREKMLAGMRATRRRHRNGGTGGTSST